MYGYVILISYVIEAGASFRYLLDAGGSSTRGDPEHTRCNDANGLDLLFLWILYGHAFAPTLLHVFCHLQHGPEWAPRVGSRSH